MPERSPYSMLFVAPLFFLSFPSLSLAVALPRMAQQSSTALELEAEKVCADYLHMFLTCSRSYPFEPHQCAGYRMAFLRCYEAHARPPPPPLILTLDDLDGADQEPQLQQ